MLSISAPLTGVGVVAKSHAEASADVVSIGPFLNGADEARRLYLDLLKKTLTDMIHVDDRQSAMVPWRPRKARKFLARPLQSLLRMGGLELFGLNTTYRSFDPVEIRRLRTIGMDWPARAHTMVGLKRLENLQHCVETVLAENVPGDFIETGVWRGGASIFVKGVLRAHGDVVRHVWLADSFRGLPPADPDRFPKDKGWNLAKFEELAISRQTVENNFRAYDLLDERVHFLEGWFKDTMPSAPVDRLAVLRLDGDLYESTIQVLEPLYPKLSDGGFVIIDDFGLAPCRAAVEDYRKANRIDEPIVDIDGMAVFWRKAVARD